MGDRRKGRLVHVASLIYGVPLAVTPQRLDVIRDVLAKRDEGLELEAATPAQRADAADAPIITPDGIAVLPVMGTFVKRAGMMDAMSGLQSYAAVTEQLRALVDNPGVHAILMQLDSPGGQVAGMFEAAHEIRAAREKKPIWALADDMAASAGYLLASAASRVLVTETGLVGSIGTLAVRRDETGADEAAGRREIIVTSGEQKADGNPHTKPTDKELARLQAKVNQMGALFAEAVAVHRGMTTEAVQALDAGTFIGAEAVRVGLADGVASLPEAIMALTAEITRPVPRMAAQAVPQTTTARKGISMTGTEQGAGGTVASIAEHPEYEKEQASARLAGASEATAYAEQVVTLCVLAGVPEKATEFLAAKTPLTEINKWAVAERAKGSSAVAGVNGTQPATATPAESAPVIDAMAIIAKRREQVLAAKAATQLALTR